MDKVNIEILLKIIHMAMLVKYHLFCPAGKVKVSSKSRNVKSQ